MPVRPLDIKTTSFRIFLAQIIFVSSFLVINFLFIFFYFLSFACASSGASSLSWSSSVVIGSQSFALTWYRQRWWVFLHFGTFSRGHVNGHLVSVCVTFTLLPFAHILTVVFTSFYNTDVYVYLIALLVASALSQRPWWVSFHSTQKKKREKY